MGALKLLSQQGRTFIQSDARRSVFYGRDEYFQILPYLGV